MRALLRFGLIGGLVLAAGCGYGPKKYYEGPTVSAFAGQLVQNGEPVTFAEDEEVRVEFTVIEGENIGKTFGVPIKPDGTFSIGWMPLGKMSGRMEWQPKDPAKQTGTPRAYGIPGSLTTEAGKTTGYVVELGKGWRRDAKARDEVPKGKKGKG